MYDRVCLSSRTVRGSYMLLHILRLLQKDRSERDSLNPEYYPFPYRPVEKLPIAASLQKVQTLTYE